MELLVISNGNLMWRLHWCIFFFKQLLFTVPCFVWMQFRIFHPISFLNNTPLCQETDTVTAVEAPSPLPRWFKSLLYELFKMSSMPTNFPWKKIVFKKFIMTSYRLCCLVYLQLLPQLCPRTLGCVYFFAFNTEIWAFTYWKHLKTHLRTHNTHTDTSLCPWSSRSGNLGG